LRKIGNIFITDHAEQRMQQRGVPLFVVPFVLAMGTTQRLANGRVRRICTRRTIPLLKKAGVQPAQIERIVGVPLIVKNTGFDTFVLTAFPRHAQSSRSQIRGATKRAPRLMTSPELW